MGASSALRMGLSSSFTCRHGNEERREKWYEVSLACTTLYQPQHCNHTREHDDAIHPVLWLVKGRASQEIAECCEKQNSNPNHR